MSDFEKRDRQKANTSQVKIRKKFSKNGKLSVSAGKKSFPKFNVKS